MALDFPTHDSRRVTPTVRPSPADLRRASSDLFTGLDAATIDALAAAMERMELAAGTVLVRQGDPADQLFVVLEGRLASVIGSAASEAVQGLGTLGPGDVVGEVAVLTGTRRTATVRSEAASTVAALSAIDLRRIAPALA